MRAVILAPQGGGKTLYMTYKAYKYWEKGYNVFANFHLNEPIQYTFIQDMYFDIDPLEKNLILLDDIAASTISGTSSSITFTQILTQSRKIMGFKDSHMYLSAQMQEQMNPKLRNLIEWFVDVYTFFSKKDKMPLVTSAKFMPRIGNTPLHEVKEVLTENVFILPYIKYYDSHERIYGIDSSMWRVVIKDYPHFVGEKDYKKECMMLCRNKYKQTIAESKRTAEFITSEIIYDVLKYEEGE